MCADAETREFRSDQDSALVVMLATGLFALVVWCFSVFTRGIEKVLAQAIMFVAAGASAWAVWAGLDRRVLLRIGAHGLYYRWFAPQTVPWTEITRVAVLRAHVAYGYVWARKLKRNSRTDQINFAVANPERYPNGLHRRFSRAMQNIAGHPQIAIQTWYVADATTEDLLAEIRRYWPGEIEAFDVWPMPN